MITAGGQIPPLDPFFNIFIPKCHPSKANFIQTHHLMNRSVRRHLKEHKKYFLIFFGFSVYTLGGLEKVKKLDFLHFCQILDVFGHFNQYNDEKSTKIKVILKIYVIKFRKSS